MRMKMLLYYTAAGFPCLSVLAFVPTTTTKYSAAKSSILAAPLRAVADNGGLSRRKFLFSWGTVFPWLGSRAASGSTLEPGKPIRIGIVGGGLAGVTAARALPKYLVDKKNVEITVLEGDAPTTPSLDARPVWTAATARNANSIATGAAMHIFSKPNVVAQVALDTVQDWSKQASRTWKRWTGQPPTAAQPLETLTQDTLAMEEEQFRQPPPYFAMHLWQCLGPSASSDERNTFVRFLRHFLVTTLLYGDEAAQERGRLHLQLAKATRHAFLQQTTPKLRSDTGCSQGFLTVHRTLASAQATMRELQEHDEEGELLEWKDAVAREPRLQRLSVLPGPLYVVRRTNDYTASCEVTVHQWIRDLPALGVRYQTGKVQQVQVVPGENNSTSHTFRVTTAAASSDSKDPHVHDFDLLILAGGVNTPLLASQLGVGEYCPTYPLRGFSLSLYVNNEKKNSGSNLLQQPFSIDSMYCSSVTPHMARWAGFGEFVGYREKAATVPSDGPATLARYARTVFPDAWNARPEEALPCFRPISPDDIPIAGEVPSLPGLFLHTGHGTLGWTTSLATGECVAQAVRDKIEGRSDEGVFALPDETEIERRVLSPARFA